MAPRSRPRLPATFQSRRAPRGRAAPANLSEDPRAEVWGVLYRITRRDLVRLDATEGVPWWRYRSLWLEAEDVSGNTLQAVTYIAEGDKDDRRPSLRYLTLLREGARAHGLPDHYIRFLEQVEPRTVAELRRRALLAALPAADSSRRFGTDAYSLVSGDGPDIGPSRMMSIEAVVNGHVIADSDDVVDCGGHQYFPNFAIRPECLVGAPTDSVSACPHGVQFYDVVIDGVRHERATSSYEAPRPAMKQVAGRFRFWKMSRWPESLERRGAPDTRASLLVGLRHCSCFGTVRSSIHSIRTGHNCSFSPVNAFPAPLAGGRRRIALPRTLRMRK